jgi:hypothetical protein
MALGTFTVVEQSAGDGPLFVDRCTVVGDGAYSAGGAPAAGGFEALYQAAVGSARTIVALIADDENLDDGSGTSDEVTLQYDHSADKLKVLLTKTGVESAQADQSGVTYQFTILSK